LLPPWRKAREGFERDGGDGDLIDYMTAREAGWEMMAIGLRGNDGEEVKRGMARFQQADAIIKKINAKQ
jgi:hypothetical protein